MTRKNRNNEEFEKAEREYEKAVQEVFESIERIREIDRKMSKIRF